MALGRLQSAVGLIATADTQHRYSTPRVRHGVHDAKPFEPDTVVVSVTPQFDGVTRPRIFFEVDEQTRNVSFDRAGQVS